MANLNKVLLLGNLTRDPELRYTPKGTAVADIALAINRCGPHEQTRRQEETTFVDITLWGRQAELAQQYLTKGKGCFIEGRLQMDTSGKTRPPAKSAASSRSSRKTSSSFPTARAVPVARRQAAKPAPATAAATLVRLRSAAALRPATGQFSGHRRRTTTRKTTSRSESNPQSYNHVRHTTTYRRRGTGLPIC